MSMTGMLARVSRPISCPGIRTGIRLWTGHAMLMKMKRANQEKHAKQSAQCPGDSRIKRPDFRSAVGQQMEQSDAQHQSAHETQNDLHPQMCQVHQTR